MDKVQWDKAKLEKFIPLALHQIKSRSLSNKFLSYYLGTMGVGVSDFQIRSILSNDTSKWKSSFRYNVLLADGLLSLLRNELRFDYDFDLEEFVPLVEAKDLKDDATTDFSNIIILEKENHQNLSELEEQRSLFSGLLTLAKEQNLPLDHPNWVDFNDAIAKEETTFLDNLKQVQQKLEAENFFEAPEIPLGQINNMSDESQEGLQKPSSPVEKPSHQTDTTVIIRIFPWRTMLLVAASIALLIFAWRWFFQPQASAEELFATHFSMDYQLAQDYLDESGFSANAEDTLFQQGIVATQQKRYQPAIVLLNTYIAKADSIYFLRPFAQELLAQLYLQTQQADLALPILNDLALNQSFENHDHCNWLLALTYIQQEQYPKAKGILQSLQNDPRWKVKAQNLLRELP
jgi:hypothetical protein